MKDNCFTALVSAKYQHGTRVSPPSGTSLAIPPLSCDQAPCSRSHRANSHWLPISHVAMCVSMLLSPYVPPPPSSVTLRVVSLFSMSVSTFLLYFLQGFLPRSPQPLCLFLYLQINLVLRSQCVLLIIWDRT